MDETKCLGVECLARTERETIVDELLVSRELISPQDLVAPVARISEEWMADVLHVCSYLVRAPRLQTALDPADVGQLFDEGVVRDSVLPFRTTFRVDRHL